MLTENLTANALLLALSVGMLYLGAEWLVRGAARVARQLRIRPMVVGLTVVAFATSAPETVIGISGSILDHSTLVLGDVIGANIANIGLIIGLSALVRPLQVQTDTWRKEVPVVMLAQVLLWVFCINGVLGRLEGVLLIALLAAFVVAMMRTAKDARSVPLPPQILEGQARPLWNVFLVAVGVVTLAAAGILLVPAAEVVARAAGLSELTIGLTVVAFGTTVPELATSVVAACRGESDIAIGNAVGSVLFNTALVLGLAGTIRPMAVGPDIIWVKLPLMIALGLALVPLVRTGFRVTRLEGAFLVACYIAFVVYSFWSGGIPQPH